MLLFVAYSILSHLNFTPNAVSNRITDFSLLLILLPIALAGLVIGLGGCRWLVTGCWPGQLAIVASTHSLTFHLGAMPTQRYPIDKLTIRYLFEMNTDEIGEDLIYEALLPQEKQLADMLPLIEAAGGSKPLNITILNLCSGTERQIAAALKPFIDYQRNNDHSDS